MTIETPWIIAACCLAGAGFIAWGAARLRLIWPLLVLSLLLAAIALQLRLAAQGRDGFHDLAAMTAQAFTVTNIGDAVVTFRFGYPSAGSLVNPDPYSLRNSTCIGPLAPGAQCSYEVVFSPTLAGTVNGNTFIRLIESATLFAASLSGAGQTATLPVVIFANAFESP